VVGKRTHWSVWVGATLTVGGVFVVKQATTALSDQQSWLATLGWFAAATIVTGFQQRWQSRSGEESPEALKERVSHLQTELRSQVQSRSYGDAASLLRPP
jgi:hypothetical protein